MEIQWTSIEKILIVRLRSIGDTVLSTPTLKTLRKFLPNARIDILLEDWVAPVLGGVPFVDEVIEIGKSLPDRLAVAREIRKRKYDMVINLHGGTTSGFLTRATGAPHRIGYKTYQYSFLYNRRYSSSADFWNKEKTHSAEQQIALIGYAGVPFEECPKTSLSVTEDASREINDKLAALHISANAYALVHPAAAYETKRWSVANFARVIDHLDNRGIQTIVVITEEERHIAEAIKTACGSVVNVLAGLTLPQVTALAWKAGLFVGNDSGIAHIAAAVDTPAVVIFGSSDINHWKPWTNTLHRVVMFPLDCQPCPGDVCREYEKPKCILSVKSDTVIGAIDELLDITSLREE